MKNHSDQKYCCACKRFIAINAGKYAPHGPGPRNEVLCYWSFRPVDKVAGEVGEVFRGPKIDKVTIVKSTPTFSDQEVSEMVDEKIRFETNQI